jgi:hypothetical protein
MINWNIVQLERKAEDGLVCVVHWELIISEEMEQENGNKKVFKARTYGCTHLDRGEEFIPFEQLTKEMVIDWVKSKLGQEQVLEFENSLQQQIEKQKNPPILTGLPW